ncbi:MAG: heterodisulfide reductase-related iron-sulfur binding cluster, partial [Anaerolineae bacterium]
MTPEAMAACRQPLEPLRPTFCNVPVWAQGFLYLGGALAVAIFAYGVYRHWRLWMGGHGPAPTATGHPRRRLALFGRHVLGQAKTMERAYPGIFHTGLFWGFCLLFIGTVLATVDWDVAHLLLGRRFIGGTFYLVYEFVLDAAGLVLVAGLFMAMYRRYFVQPAHVVGEWDFVLWTLLVVNVSGFAVEGLRLAMAPVDWGGVSFVGQTVADGVFLAPAWFLTRWLAPLHLALWLFHAVAALVFIAAVPYTNAVHMLTAATNAVLQPVDGLPAGARLAAIDIETAEVYGVGHLAEFTWKQRLGVDSCVRCGRCETVCQAVMSASPLNPKRIIVNLSQGLWEGLPGGGGDLPGGAAGGGPADPGGPGPGAGDPQPAIIGAEALVDPEALWGCTTCLACVEACPSFIEIVDDVVDMRRHLALMEGELPGTAGGTLRNMMTAGNPWGYAAEDRAAWAEGLDVPRAKPGDRVDVLYFVGCSSSYDKRNQRIARAMVRLLEEAGVSYAIMAKERCTAESGRRLGEEYLYQTATAENVEQMAHLDFDRVLCHCPHCFNTIRNEYPQFGGQYEVIHHTQLIRELVAAGRLPACAADQGRVTFHDSCYLGRYNGEFEAPRDTLKAAGIDVVEMPRRREKGLCCGGGGGKMWFEGAQDRAVGEVRMEEALALEPDVVGVACPFCLTMLDSAKSYTVVVDEDAAAALARVGPGGA